MAHRYGKQRYSGASPTRRKGSISTGHKYLSKGQSRTELIQTIRKAQSKSGYLARQDISILQASLGNQTVQRLLKNGSAKTKTGLPTIKQELNRSKLENIQRFPTDPTTQKPINWAQETESVTKSGSGVQGVFFPVDQGGTKLVIKPEFVDSARPTTAEQSQMADKFLSKMGFQSPNSRIVDGGSTEATAIVETVSSKFVVPGDVEDAGAFREQMKQRLNQVPYFKIMAFDRKPSLEELVKDATNENKMQELVQQVFARVSIMMDLGRLVVADSFMGNDDRVEKSAANIGNVLIQDGTVSTIDSDASFSEIRENMDGSVGMPDSFGGQNAIRMLNNLFDDPGGIFDSFIDNGIVAGKLQKMAATEVFDPTASFLQAFGPHRKQAKLAFLQGILMGKDQLVDLFKSQQAMTELKQEAETPYASSIGGPKKTLWNTFEGRKLFFLKRMGGGEHGTAAAAQETAEGFHAASKYKNMQFNSKGILHFGVTFPHYPKSAHTFIKSGKQKSAEAFKIEMRGKLLAGGSTADAEIKKYETLLKTHDQKYAATQKAKFFVDAMRAQQVAKGKWLEIKPYIAAVKDMTRAAATEPQNKGFWKNKLAQATVLLATYRQESEHLKTYGAIIRELIGIRSDLSEKGDFSAYLADMKKWTDKVEERVADFEMHVNNSSASVNAL